LTEWVEMLVEGFKLRVKAETEVKETVGKGAAKPLRRAGECSAQCPFDGTSLLPSHVRFSKRDTKPDVRLLLVPVCGVNRLPEKKSLPTSSATVGRSLQGAITSQLSSVALAPTQIGSI